MCDIQTATAGIGGKRMDIDKEFVQVVAVVGGVIIACAALIFDGDLGYAMGTGVISIASGAAGYIFGKSVREEVQQP